MFVKDRVSDLLSNRVSDLEQRSRRYCVNIKGVKVKQNENLHEEVQNLVNENSANVPINEIDKFHRDGERDGDKQDLIIRFKSHFAKEAFYKARGSMARVKSKNIKVQPSLSTARKKLLGQATEYISSFHQQQKQHQQQEQQQQQQQNSNPDDHHDQPNAYFNAPHFALADVHGNLMVKMTERTNDGMFFHFDSLQKLADIIQKYSSTPDAYIAFDEMMAKYEKE